MPSAPAILDAQRIWWARGDATAHASANTKGTYAQMSAALPHTADWVQISGWSFTAVNRDQLGDFAIGAATSEIDIISNYPIQGARMPGQVLVPLGIPDGVRLAFRVQSTTGGTSVRGIMWGIQFGMLNPGSLGRCTTYGATTADSGGTSIDPGATPGTPGSYVQLSAATTAPIKWLLAIFGNQINSARTDCNWELDVATGAATSEVIQIAGLNPSSWSAHDQIAGCGWAFPVSIPEGVRLSVRATCDTADATDRLIDCILIGVG